MIIALNVMSCYSYDLGGQRLFSGNRPQLLIIQRKIINRERPPQFVVAEGHNYMKFNIYSLTIIWSLKYSYYVTMESVCMWVSVCMYMCVCVCVCMCYDTAKSQHSLLWQKATIICSLINIVTISQWQVLCVCICLWVFVSMCVCVLWHGEATPQFVVAEII